MPTITLTAEDIDRMADERAESFDWGYKEYLKRDGRWYLDHIIILNRDERMSTFVYTDNRPCQTVPWGSYTPR